VPASDQPLYVILLIDYSESMIEEMPVVKAAARQFAQALLRPTDRIAVVGFNQSLFWLTGFTNDFNAAAQAVDRVKPGGETHLYDSAIEMLYELQKQPGRHALVVFTDGVDQGSTFKLEHLVHYARYSGVPLYPVIKNRMLMKLMRFGVGYLQARKIASIARDTGATYFIIQRETELPAVYARIAQDQLDVDLGRGRRLASSRWALDQQRLTFFEPERQGHGARLAAVADDGRIDEAHWTDRVRRRHGRGRRDQADEVG